MTETSTDIVPGVSPTTPKDATPSPLHDDAGGIKPDKIITNAPVLATSGLLENGGLPIDNPLAPKKTPVVDTDVKVKGGSLETDAAALEAGTQDTKLPENSVKSPDTTPELAPTNLVPVASQLEETMKQKVVAPPPPKPSFFARLSQLVLKPSVK